MKRVLAISVLLLLAADVSHATLIYIESPQAECLLCGPLCGGPCQLYYDSSFPVIEINIWVQPDARGVIGASLRVEYPANVLVMSVETNPLIISITGDLVSGTSYMLAECQLSLFRSHRLSCLIWDPSYGLIYLNPHPDYGLTVTSCESGSPVYPASGIGAWLGLNGTYATEETSWGAIKRLYGD